MRKLSLLFVLLFVMGSLVAQETIVTWDGLTKQKGKSDADIINVKKNVKSKTWVKRADLYYSIYTFNTKGLYVGMPMESGMIDKAFVVGAKDVVGGDPKSKKQVESEMVWEYPRKKLFFDKNGRLARWEETEFIDKEAILKSAKAYIKADELDEKGTLKNKATFKIGVRDTRNYVVNKAVDYYSKEKHKEALKYMTLASKLGEFPKDKSDSLFDNRQLVYFMGLIALKGGMTDDARANFKRSIESKYQEGACYHYLAESYAVDGDSAAFIAKVKEGFEKYPEEEQLLIDLINYYINKNQPEKVIEYLDIAISKNPTNPSYYSAKGTVYFNKYSASLSKYTTSREDAHKYKKQAFVDRNNAKKKLAAEKSRDAALKVGDEAFLLIFKDLDKAEEFYNESIKLDEKAFNAAYNVGSINLKRSRVYALESDFVIKIFKDFNKSEVLSKKSDKALEVAAQKFEDALKISPTDRDALKTLRSIYFRMRDTANVDRLDAIIEKLPAVQKSGIE